MKKTLFITLCIFTASCVHAQGKKLSLLEAGNYALESGPADLCSSFSLLPADLNGRVLNIGARYAFITLNSSRSVESDIDANCEFREQSVRNEDKPNEITLSRLNEEVCGGKTASRTLSTLVIQAGELSLTHHIAGADPYTCVWKKR